MDAQKEGQVETRTEGWMEGERRVEERTERWSKGMMDGRKNGGKEWQMNRGTDSRRDGMT